MRYVELAISERKSVLLNTSCVFVAFCLFKHADMFTFYLIDGVEVLKKCKK